MTTGLWHPDCKSPETVRIVPTTRRTPTMTAHATSQISHEERRAHRRLEIRLPVELRRTGDGPTVVVRTITQNISTGGMYLELDRPDFAEGDRLSVQITVPPAEGVSPYAGRASCIAEILRVIPRNPGPGGEIERYGVAARFLDRLRITY